jgi:hypothetical protein
MADARTRPGGMSPTGPMTVLGTVGIATLALAVTVVGLRGALALRATWPREVNTLVLPPASALRVLSLGHAETAADLIAARANVYFGAQIANQDEQRALAQALNLAVDMDPQFRRLYLRGAAMLVYNGRAITVDSLLAANGLLERGWRAFPGDWELPFQMGFNLLFELPKLVGEEDPRVPDWRQRGIEALRQATLLDGVPPWLPNLAARMLTKEGGEELAIRHLERSYAATNNPTTRAEIVRKLAELHGRHRADELRAGAAALEKLVAEGYPYAPEAFSVILGPRKEAGVDLERLLLQPGAPPTAPPSLAPAP